MKKLPRWAWILSGVVLLILVLGLLTNWFGLNGPALQMGLAAGKTLGAGNFTLDIQVSGKALGLLELGSESVAQVELDIRNRSLLVHIQSGIVHYGIADGFLLQWKADSQGNVGSISCRDIRPELERFFDSFDGDGSGDPEEITAKLEALLDAELSDRGLVWSMLGYGARLNNTFWLKQYAGYSRSHEAGVTTCSFRPPLYEFSRESLECFSGAFADPKDHEALMGQLARWEPALDACRVSLAVSLFKGQLARIEMEMRTGSLARTNVVLEFREVGTTRVDAGLLRQILRQAQK